MKKIKLVLSLFCIALLASCSLFAAEPKTFTEKDVTVTLTDDYHVSETDNVYVTIESKKALFMVNREARSLYEAEGIYDITDSEFVEAVLEGAKKEYDEVLAYSDEETSFAYSYYTAKVSNNTFSYMIVGMQTNNYYYTINFGSLESTFDDQKDDFLAYAKTIRLEVPAIVE